MSKTIVKAKVIKRKYKSIRYKASNGKWYNLNDMFPICMDVEGKDDCVYLDTGGTMEGCDFAVFSMTKDTLYREGKCVASIRGL